MLSEAALQREAASTGFRPEVLEKAIRLIDLLDGVRSHPFLVYGGINRRDWRTVSVEEAQTDVARVERELMPLLRARVAPSRPQLAEWAGQLVGECRRVLSAVPPLRANEIEFLDRLNERGEIAPELLTDDGGLQTRLRSHPGLLWKAVNVCKHRGLDDEDAT